MAASDALPLSLSLRDELAAALARRQPLLVLVSLDGCPFCKEARQNYLRPLLEQEGQAVVQLDMRSRQPVLDFRGASRTHDAMVRHWGVKIAPTVLFFGRDGVEAAERMAGAYIPDFYGAYLEQRLAQARAAVR